MPHTEQELREERKEALAKAYSILLQAIIDYDPFPNTWEKVPMRALERAERLQVEARRNLESVASFLNI